MPVKRVGTEPAPSGGPAAVAVAAESYEGASWTVVCYYSVRHGDQKAPGDMEPPGQCES